MIALDRAQQEIVNVLKLNDVTITKDIMETIDELLHDLSNEAWNEGYNEGMHEVRSNVLDALNG